VSSVGSNTAGYDFISRFRAIIAGGPPARSRFFAFFRVPPRSLLGVRLAPRAAVKTRQTRPSGHRGDLKPGSVVALPRL